MTVDRQLSEDLVPEGGLAPTPTTSFDSEEHHAKTRRILAFSCLGTLAAFYAAVLWMYAADNIKPTELGGLIAGFSGLQTLTAAAFGFYFASGKK